LNGGEKKGKERKSCVKRTKSKFSSYFSLINMITFATYDRRDVFDVRKSSPENKNEGKREEEGKKIAAQNSAATFFSKNKQITLKPL
jgi:hypothetical protein